MEPWAEKNGDPLVGTTLGDRYEILSLIGTGGWSSVYRAQDTTLKRQVALKMLHAHLSTDSAKVERFRREAEATAAIVHPNLAAIYDSGIASQSRPYFVMELIEGGSLTDMICARGRLAAVACVELFAQLLDALSVIHDRGLLHRDLKPGNVLITETNQVKVVDFGMAKWILADNPLTKTDEAVGTPAYMSPEQCLGKKLDARSDIYSVGCMLYEALSGRKPFHSENLFEYMNMQTKSRPPALSDVQIPQELKRVVMKTLEKDPGDRQSSASQLKTELLESLQPASLERQAKRIICCDWVPDSKKRKIVISLVCVTIVGAAAAMPVAQMLRQRNLKFPSSHSVGTVYLMQRDSQGDPKEKTFLSHARDTVSVPYDAFVQLAEVPPETAGDLSFITDLKSDDIQSLDLYGQTLSENAVTSINHLMSLKLLSLSDSKIDDSALSKLRLDQLEGLNLTDTNVSSQAIRTVVENERRLQWISLKGCKKIDNIALAALKHLPELGCIIIDNVPSISDLGMEDLVGSHRLSVLTVNHDKISDTGIGLLTGIKTLNRIHMAGTAVTDAGIKYFSDLPRLRRLDLSGTAISDQCIDNLSKFKHLKSLFVSDTKMTSAGIARLKKMLPECEIVGGK